MVVRPPSSLFASLVPLFVGCSGGAPVSAPVVPLAPPPEGQLVFASDRDGGMGVYAVASPGGPVTRIDPADGAAWFPGPASAGGVALLRVEDGPGDHHAEQLFIHGATTTAVGPPARAVRNPAWTLDHTGVLFESSAEGFRDIYLGLPDGAAHRQTALAAGCYEPRPLSDGTRMVVVCSGRDPDLRVVPLGRDTPVADPVRLMERVGEDLRPTPGGSDGRLAFYGELDGQLGVWTVREDGLGAGPAWQPTDKLVLVADLAPEWSPDGHTLAVTLRRPTGPPVVRLLTFPGDGGAPVATARPIPGIPDDLATEGPLWLSDGTLVLTVDSGDNADIWRVDTRTGATEVWVDSGATDWLPRWWPTKAKAAG